MKTNKALIALCALMASALIAAAEDAGGPPAGGPPGQHQDGPPQGGGPGGPGQQGGRRPPPNPLLMALDANHDGVLDADEIANAPAALKKLDKNGDGKLTQDELRPPRPDRGGEQHPPSNQQ